MLFRWPWQSAATPPDFYQQYLSTVKLGWEAHTPIEQLRFVVFDTETTGLNPAKDRLLSIGAVACSANTLRVEDVLDIYVQNEQAPHNPEAITVHGILQGQLSTAHSEAEAVAAFTAFCGNAVLVGHHLAFDIAMIDGALRRAGAGTLKNRRIDTMDLARRANAHTDFLPPGFFQLDQLAARYGIPLSDRHTAAGDAYITALLLFKLLGQLKKRGVNSLRDLLR